MQVLHAVVVPRATLGQKGEQPLRVRAAHERRAHLRAEQLDRRTRQPDLLTDRCEEAFTHLPARPSRFLANRDLIKVCHKQLIFNDAKSLARPRAQGAEGGGSPGNRINLYQAGRPSQQPIG